MNQALLEAHYRGRGYDPATAQEAVDTVGKLENDLLSIDTSLDTVSLDDIKQYLDGMILRNENQLPKLLAIARYYYLIHRHDIYLYFTKLLGGLGVIDSIKERTERYAGHEVKQAVFDGLQEKPLGTAPEDMPAFTEDLMYRLQCSMEPKQYQKVLAGNNHGIPKDAMLEEKRHFEKSTSLEAYLKERHQRKVQELQTHCDEKKVWFEQEITQAVVDYVKSNQEILSAVLEGDTLYVTKIPYEPEKYLKETDPRMKRYYTCHCPFAREVILHEEHSIPADWCYCSAGFAKFPFEVILDRELEVTMLQSALKGDPVCRFAIHLGSER